MRDDREKRALLTASSDRCTADACRVQLMGDLDASAQPVLDRVLAPLLERPGLTRMVLDLSDVSFVDAAGLGALVHVRSTLRERGASLALAGCQLPLLQALEITRLINLFEITAPQNR